MEEKEAVEDEIAGKDLGLSGEEVEVGGQEEQEEDGRIVEGDSKVLKERNKEEQDDRVLKEKGGVEGDFAWTGELEDILEGLVEESFFDFGKVADQMNAMLCKRGVTASGDKQGKLSVDEIRRKWTEIELKYRDDTPA